MGYPFLRVIGIGFLVIAGLRTATWLSMGGTDPAAVQANLAEAPKTSSSPQMEAPTTQREQDFQSKGDTQVRTEIVRRLLKALDNLPNVDPKQKRELRRILLDSDKQLVQAVKSPETPRATSEQSERKEQKPSTDGGKSPSFEGPKSPVIKALLDLLDDIPQDDLADHDSRQTDTLRENLIQADKILSQHLGRSAVNRIKAANRKPTVPRVFNPPRKAQVPPSQQNAESEKTTQ
ncbi:hypothetical protein [Thermogutta sp.]|uniref:hypothetical protein n=1 Tax=Thermogutta sp. TaxID=1962930 RepID=UPI00321F7CE8